MTAQRLQEDARQTADKERELLLREAQLEARSLRDDALRQLVREQEALREVRARRAQLVASFRRMLDRELSELDVIERALELGGSTETSAGEAPVSASVEGRRPEVEPAGAPERSGAADDPSESSTEPAAVAGDEDQARSPDAVAQPAGLEGRRNEPEGGSEGDGPVQEDWLSSFRHE
jgi:hypothetical protein